MQIYVYIYRERERDRYIHIHTCISATHLATVHVMKVDHLGPHTIPVVVCGRCYWIEA